MCRERIRKLVATFGLSLLLPAACDFGKPLGATEADAATGGSAGTAAGDGAPAEAIVTIQNLAFVPAELHVKAGTTVRWVMQDPGTFHFVVQGLPGQPESPNFASGKLEPGDDFTHAFPDPGTFIYFCSNHSNVMRNAKIVVE